MGTPAEPLIDTSTLPNIYRDKGYENRRDYLESLAEEYEVEYETVKALADILGPNEEFDGLVTQLQDLETIGL